MTRNPSSRVIQKNPPEQHTRRHGLCRRQAALQGASVATLFCWTLDIAAANGSATHQHEWAAANPGERLPRRDRFRWQVALVDQLLGIETLRVQTKRGREALKSVEQVAADGCKATLSRDYHWPVECKSERCAHCAQVSSNQNQTSSVGCNHPKCRVKYRRGRVGPVCLHIKCFQAYHEHTYAHVQAASTQPQTEAPRLAAPH